MVRPQDLQLATCRSGVDDHLLLSQDVHQGSRCWFVGRLDVEDLLAELQTTAHPRRDTGTSFLLGVVDQEQVAVPVGRLRADRVHAQQRTPRQRDLGR